MKAVRITTPGGPEVLRLEELPAPEPGREEIRVRIRAAALNRADLMQRRGRYPAPPDVPADVPGLEYAGHVVEVGDRVRGLEPDDRVMGLLGGGGYAQEAVVPAGMALPMPDGLSFVEAAAVPEAFITAYDALFRRAAFGAGERVLVHSAGGGVGTAALQLARAGGASLVVGTASGPKLEAIRDAGLPLDVGVNYREDDFAGAVERHTGGEGVDVILDTVGADYWDRNVACLARRGRMVLVGLLGGRRADVDLGAILRRRLTVVGTVLRSRPVSEKIELTREVRRRVLPLFSRGQLRPVVDRTWPLAEAAEAHAYMEANRNFGKIVLEVG